MFIAPALLLSASITTVATYRWDLSATAGVQDGQGTWNSTNTYFTKDNGATRVAWVPGSIAQFGGGVSGTAAGNIITGTQTCNGLIFNTPFAGSYTFGGGTIAFSGTSPFIECNSATGMTGSGVLSATYLTIRGSAVFTIAGASTPNVIDTLNVTSGATVTFNAVFTTKVPTNLIADGTVNFSSGTSTAAVSSVISGSGSVNVSSTAGFGSVTITGNSTFTGTFTIASSSSVAIGNGVLSSGDVGPCSLVANSNFDINRVGTWTFSANASGTGNVRFLRGDITMTGAWAAGTVTVGISAATTLRIGAGGTTGSVASNISVSGSPASSVVFNRSDNYTYNNLISGAGSVTHASTATLTFALNQTYTGTTTISAGPLRLGGTLAATAITVANVAGASIGLTAPGTKTIGGSITFAGSNAALDVQTNGTNGVSRLTVTGGVVRGGAKVNVLGALNAGSYIIISGSAGASSGSEFTIGTNLSGRTCTFSTVSGVTTMTAT